MTIFKSFSFHAAFFIIELLQKPQSRAKENSVWKLHANSRYLCHTIIRMGYLKSWSVWFTEKKEAIDRSSEFPSLFLWAPSPKEEGRHPPIRLTIFLLLLLAFLFIISNHTVNKHFSIDQLAEARTWPQSREWLLCRHLSADWFPISGSVRLKQNFYHEEPPSKKSI